MSRKLQTTQSPFTMLVANLTGGSDPSKGVAGNPVKSRTGFRTQHIVDVNVEGPMRAYNETGAPGISTHKGLVAGLPVAATGTIVVADNDFTNVVSILLGDFEIVSGVDFAVGISTALTAVALAAAIDALPGYSAPVPGASTITVTGPVGLMGNTSRFDALYTGGIQNYTLSPTNGALGGGGPFVGPPTLLP